MTSNYIVFLVFFFFAINTVYTFCIVYIIWLACIFLHKTITLWLCYMFLCVIKYLHIYIALNEKENSQFETDHLIILRIFQISLVFIRARRNVVTICCSMSSRWNMRWGAELKGIFKDSSVMIVVSCSAAHTKIFVITTL